MFKDKSPINEILDFLVSQPTAEQIINLRASEAAQARLAYLFDNSRSNLLNDAERAELETYLQLDNLVTRLKARARLKLIEPA